MASPVVDTEYLKEIDKACRDIRALIALKNCAPIILSLAWHDAGSYDVSTKTGGPNRSIRNEEEYTHGANNSLKIALDFCEGVKAKHPKITYADHCPSCLWNTCLREFNRLAIECSRKLDKRCPISQRACGGALRDHLGEWVFGFSKSIGRCSVLDTELWGIYEEIVHELYLENLMKLSQQIASRPVTILILLALLVLLPPCIVITWWNKTTRQISDNVNLNTRNLHSGFLSQIDTIAKSIPPLNSSAISLAKLLSSSFNQTSEISFNDIETKVAPTLFLAFSTIPYLSQISYVGSEGLFFSYYFDGNQALSTYANSSFSSNPKQHVWYIQPVDNHTGKLYGEADGSPRFNAASTSWFQAALRNSWGYSSVENGWSNGVGTLFLTSVGMLGRGVVSLGVSVKRLTDLFSGLDLYGGSLSLTTMDGKLLVNGIQNTKFISVNSSIFLQLMNPNGSQNVSCSTPESYILYIGEKVYTVYALASPRKGSASLVHRKINHSHIALVATIVLLVIALVFFVTSMGNTAQREVCLHDKLIKQMEATQQAERKSMNKSLALVGASHDIRASLAGINGFIDLCLVNAAPGSDFDSYLKQMSHCAHDLLGLLNSILDTSKIEAGMMNLVEQEFNLAELVEHVVDLYHPVGMIKGVDVVLDPCDGSIIKLTQVKGDRGKLMQILSNVLSNAVKFTDEGHVCLRAWVRKPDFETELLCSSRNNFHKYLSRLFNDRNETNGDVKAIGAVMQNPDSVEIVFKVDDTGKGIPKEKQKSVFENYVQVKETAAGQVGTGLGLGIVQSLVRLMGGEIGIVDKEIGEKGTCFRFNVFLTCEISSSSNKETQGDAIRPPILSSATRTSSLKLAIRSPSPKSDGSQVVLFMQNDERRRVSQKFMQGLGISVSVVDQCNYLPSALKQIQLRLNSNNHSSRRLDMSHRSENSSFSSKDVPLSAMEGTDHKLSLNRRQDTPSFILLVVDVNAGPFSELWRIVAEFRRGLQSTCCKVVWLDKPTARMINPIRLDPGDEVLLQPFHGSRLHRVIKLLPEFGATSSLGVSGNQESSKHAYNKARLMRNSQHNGEIQEYVSSSDERYSKRGSSSPTLVRTQGRVKSKISSIIQNDARVERREAVVRKTNFDRRG
ncbi:histidine kinase CKI1-like [Hibiscus syriacus]|uniref:histidine kinase CKI1-like n=1 Tax=Hibiscus syriacus TaxID=106335 RepID=UPI001922F8F5|nr:histidine kinase CKI1-like [Hibiscus syriacus]